MKKQLLSATLILAAFTGFSQEIKVKEDNEHFSNGNHPALTTTIYTDDVNLVEKEWKSLLKDHGYDKASDKGDEFFFDNVVFKPIGNNTVDVYSKVDRMNGEKAVKLSAAYDLGGAYLSSSEHADKFNFLKKMMRDFAVKISQEAADDEIKATTKVLAGLQSKQTSLEKDNKELNEDIVNYNQKIEKAKSQITQNTKDIETKKTEVTAQQKVVDAVKAKKAGIK